ncbi:hypothetical protein LTR01_006229 [Friedmanniomyces endolithicus]|nr:hypothetical protein LTR01_006229 [Friedmanniomyces endolithicus]
MAEPSEPIHAGPLTSHPPDLMNDATFGTPPRRTTSSTATTEDKAGDTCRICRSEGTHDEPLFYPCKCSGSIKYVHQECLMEWLGHSHKKHCELCKTPFRFTKLYDAEMPQTLPWAVFIRRACWHAVWMSGKLGRATMVVIMWAIVLPWLVRWAWRWMFWLADAGWAREAVLGSLQEQDLGLSAGALWNGNESLVLNQISKKLGRMVELNLTLRSAHGAEAATPGPAAYQIARDVMKGLGLAASESTTSSFAAFPEVDTSILSSWTYLSTLTPFPRLNQVIIDICEGQLITCVVIVGFILVFLIREWVVQQQPLVNLDNLNNAQQQLAEAVQRVEAENVRLDRQQEILDQVRRRLTELQDESPGVDTGESVAYGTFLGWDRLESLINTATMHLRKEGEGDNSVFEFCAQAAVDQIRFAGQPPDNEITDELAEKIATKLASLTDDQRAAWELLLRRERANLPFLATNPPQIHAPSEEHLEVQESAEDDFEELPITNAGPDAKVNIKRSGKGKARAVPGPEERTPADVNKRKQEDEALKDFLGEMNLEGSAAVAPSPAGAQSGVTNPFHPDGPEPEVRQGEGVERDAASELVAHEGPESDMPTRQPSDEERQAHDAPPGMNEATADVEEGDDDEYPPRRPVIPPTYINRLVDWFWGDIQVSADHRDPPPPDEERELPFDIHEDLPPLPPAVHAVHVHHHHDPHELHGHDEPQDPADIAARQAALDADALEEAEDLEGIFELIGLQGPLLGLFQTSTFCTILVTGTVFAAVGLPYVWGKVVLNIIGSPLYFAVQLPLQIAGFVADFVVDVTLFAVGWAIVGGTTAVDLLLEVCGTPMERLKDVRMATWLADFAMATATKSGARLQHLFLTMEPVQSEIMGWNEAFLGASVHAHASLREVQEEVAAILNWSGHGVTVAIEAISSGTTSSAWQNGLDALSHAPSIPSRFLAIVEVMKQYTQPLVRSLGLLKTGSLSFDANPATPLEPSLIYWSTSDRTLAVLAGYLSLALLAALYVALDTPLTRSESGRKSEKQLRDTLKQAGGVLKVILIISIEMLLFPFYCGLLLDLAFLPLFASATLASRWTFAGSAPYTFCFVHWFVGTCYMFHFALFVGMCRKILRKGVLWFIRDPDDPTFHPVRDVLERNVTTQLRKIAFSALVYGALVILCLGGVIWTIGKVMPGIFPICWASTEPVLEFPLDLLLYNALTPWILRVVKPSDAVNAMYAWWLRRCARVLRLSHFLFDDRRKDEEGHYVRKSWSSFLLQQNPIIEPTDPDTTAAPILTARIPPTPSPAPEVHLAADGKYVLTPCTDQYRPPKSGEAFLHVTPDGDVYVADAEGKRNEHFAKVYVPPFFRLRVTLFMVCLWVFSVFTGLCVTLVPLVFGRGIFKSVMPEGGGRVGDIYAYSVGAYALGGVLVVLLQGRKAVRVVREKTEGVDVKGLVRVARQYALQAVKCAYVYGFLCVVLPLVFGLLIQLYFILPLHTYVVSQAAATTTTTTTTTTSATSETAATSLAANLTYAATALTLNTLNILNTTAPSSSQPMPGTLPPPLLTIHLLQSYCLGLLYVRLASRAIVFAPTTRAHEAFHRILLDPGYLDPNAYAATRFLIAPVSLLGALAVLGPPGVVGVAVAAAAGRGGSAAAPGLVGSVPEEMQAMLYRYSYPLAAVLVIMLLCVSELGQATVRWRARIRDEVYLVGERLHNFGEKRPPVGSRTLVRKDR